MGIKSKKFKAAIQQQRQIEKQKKEELERLEKEGPHGIGCDRNQVDTIIEHWDGSKKLGANNG